jgi:hypothetical protein
MRKFITNQFNKAVPVIERAVKWLVSTAFELLKLIGLAFMVMHLIVATLAIEAVLTTIVVFAALYFTKAKR